MSEIDLVAGNRFRLYRQNDTTPANYDYMAVATTVSFTRQNNFEEGFAPDATDPFKTPVRKRITRSYQWDLTFSGQIDAKLLEKIEADADSGDAHSYRITTDMALAKGGKTYTGLITFDTLEIGTQNRGFVTFSAKCGGDGFFTTTPAAA